MPQIDENVRKGFTGIDIDDSNIHQLFAEIGKVSICLENPAQKETRNKDARRGVPIDLQPYFDESDVLQCDSKGLL